MYLSGAGGETCWTDMVTPVQWVTLDSGRGYQQQLHNQRKPEETRAHRGLQPADEKNGYAEKPLSELELQDIDG